MLAGRHCSVAADYLRYFWNTLQTEPYMTRTIEKTPKETLWQEMKKYS
jgi:hypothetical protein